MRALGTELDTGTSDERIRRLARFAAVGLCPNCRSALDTVQPSSGALVCPVCSYAIRADAGFVYAMAPAESTAPAPERAADWATGIATDMDAKRDTYVDKYERRSRASSGFFTRLELAVEMAGPEPGRTLEPGCGPGIVSPLLSQSGVDTHALDLSAGQLSTAVGRDPHTLYVQGDLERLPYRDQAFATIVLLGVFEYVDRPERVAQELARVLEPGGRLILSVPNSHGLPRIWTHHVYIPLSRLLKRLIGKAVPAYSRRLYSLKNLTRLLSGVALRVEKARFFEVVLAPPPIDRVLGGGEPRLAGLLERRLHGRLRRAFTSQILVSATHGAS